MKKYCLISFCNMYVLPYAKIYIDAILSAGAQCDLIYWDRDAVDGANDSFDGCRKFCYQRKITPESSRKEKLFGYIGSRRFFIERLKKNDYDGVIFLQTHAAVACNHILKRKYKKKFIVDVRDFTMESFWLYRKLEKAAIFNAYATVISSPAYREFLPPGEFVIAHNYSAFPQEMVERVRESAMLSKSDPIRISFVGTVRFIDMDMKILRLFANDSRFQINYFGAGSETLAAFCKKEGILNAKFHGSFSPNQTVDFYLETDIINNLYGNHSPFLDYALSNKLYHAGQLHLPILVCPKTYMEKISLVHDMGFVFDVDCAEDKDRLYKWFHELDRKKLADGSDSFIKSVIVENMNFTKMIESFLV